MASIRPSTWAGTPESMCAGGVPIRAGQYSRTRSWLPPMPPLATITALPRSSNSSTTSRLLAVPAGGVVAAQDAAAHPDHRAGLDDELVDPMAELQHGVAAAHRARATAFWNGSSSPGPVPQTMWNRGTELPWPVAV